MNDLTKFGIISKHRLGTQYLDKLRVCLESLSQEEIWDEQPEGSNSVGGIVLHIILHVERNTERINAPAKKFEQGIENHFPREDGGGAELISDLQTAFGGFEKAIDSKALINLYDVYHLVEHVSYHLGQIVDRAQRLAGKKFRFVQNGVNEAVLSTKIEEELGEGLR